MELVPSFAAFMASIRDKANEAAQPATEVAAVTEAKKDDEKEEKAKKDDDKSDKGDDAEKSDDKKEKPAKPWEAKKESVEAEATVETEVPAVEVPVMTNELTILPTFENFMAARKAAATT